MKYFKVWSECKNKTKKPYDEQNIKKKINILSLTKSCTKSYWRLKQKAKPAIANIALKCNFSLLLRFFFFDTLVPAQLKMTEWYLIVKKERKKKSLSHVWLFATPGTVAYQALPSMGFSRQEYWSGLPFPSPGDLPNPGIEPGSPAL